MAATWNTVAKSLDSHSLSILHQLGWPLPGNAVYSFFEGPNSFLATLESTNMRSEDIQTVLILCFVSLREGMNLEVAWIENGTDKWYPCTLKKLPPQWFHLVPKTKPTGHWWKIEDTVKKLSGPWHLTSSSFNGEEFVLFDPFLDTFKVVQK